MITITRYHDFSAGHRVMGHENKCSMLHGHNYRVHFTLSATFGLDKLGRVMDFSEVNRLLCNWLETNWDHKMLLSEDDEVMVTLATLGLNGIVPTAFNPTAENMAWYLLRVIGPQVLSESNCLLIKVVVEETRKCSATAEINQDDIMPTKF